MESDHKVLDIQALWAPNDGWNRRDNEVVVLIGWIWVPYYLSITDLVYET